MNYTKSSSVNSEESKSKLNDIIRRLEFSNSNFKNILRTFDHCYSSAVDNKKEQLIDQINKNKDLVRKIENLKIKITSETSKLNNQIALENKAKKREVNREKETKNVVSHRVDMIH